MYKKNFNEQGLVPIKIIIKTNKGRITSKTNIKNIYNYINKVKKPDSVKEINSIVTIHPQISLKQYQYMYGNKITDKNIKQLLNNTTREKFTLVSIVSKYGPNSKETANLIKYIEILLFSFF